MGFNDAKAMVIACLNSGNFVHEARTDIDVKNLLETGVVTAQEVSSVIRRSSGNQHKTSPHHFDANTVVHIIKTRHQGQDWYIKWYFADPSTVFISVHH